LLIPFVKLSFQTIVVAVIATLLSVTAFLYFYHNGMTNFYGDGLAHVNIARKVVDHPESSLWQRYVQIGSPWLPLQTVLMLPLVANDWLWRTGIAGSLVSMLCFVITALAVFKLAQNLYSTETDEYRNLLPVVAFGIFALSPSNLFMQSTPMTELIFMAALSLAVWTLQNWATNQSFQRLVVAAITMTIATMSRYEAWSVAAIACALVFVLSQGNFKDKAKNLLIFSAIVVVCPLYWLWHNWVIYGDALWFLTGPHSARGIYLQNRANLGWANIFVGHALLDLLLMTLTVAACVGLLMIPLATLGFFRILKTHGKATLQYTPTLLLAVPFFFHCFSLYRGEIQIFPLSAFGLLNVRYGLPHLMAIALFVPAVIPMLRRFGKVPALVFICLLVAAQYLYLISDGTSQLAIYQEGYRNGVNSRVARQWAKTAQYLREQPPPTKILMQTGSLGPVVSQGGLRFARIIHEGTAAWHRISEKIPADIFTIIIERDDGLEQKIKANAALQQDVMENFEMQFSFDKVQIFRRRR